MHSTLRIAGHRACVRLALAGALTVLAGPAAGGERVSTAQPFAVGDIFVAATLMNDPDDDHRGVGRILQFDAQLQPKGVLWVEHTTHKLGGLTFAPDGTLWGFAQQSWDVIEIGPDGRLLPPRNFGNRTFSNVTFAPDGSLYFGEHLQGGQLRIAFNTTVFSYMPGTERIGDGHIFHYSADGRLLEEFANDTHGGMAGIHGATSTVLADGGTRMIYISETGNRLMQYDLAGRRQLPDLAVYDPGAGGPPMVLFMTALPDGTLVIATGASLMLVDPDSGATRQTLPMGSSGWAAVTPSNDDGHVLLGNFFTGEFVKLRLADGEVVARNTIGEKNSLSGIAQYAGRHVIRKGPGFGQGNRYEQVIESSEAAFMRRDLEGAIAALDEDYVLYDIGDEGPRPRMRGKAEVRELLGRFFAASDSWVGSEVDKWGLIDNLLVQVEYDTYRTGDGDRTVPTLVVFEHRDGKRWREWRFRPQDR